MDITNEQLSIADSLSGKSEPTVKFNWSETFQKNLAGMLLSDQYFLIQARDKIKPEYFSNESHIFFVNRLFKYYDKYNSIPKKFFLEQEIHDGLKEVDANIKLHYLSELEQCYDYYVPGLESRDALVDKIISFAKTQAVKIAFYKSLEKLKKDPDSEDVWNFIIDETVKAVSIDKNYDNGLEYFINPNALFERMLDETKPEDIFTSGFMAIDNALSSKGIKRGELASWIGLPGTGKSLALVKGAVENVKRGHKVLYLTMEMDEVGIAERFTSMFTGFSINNLLNEKESIIDLIKTFTDESEDKNRLIVKQFPGGELDVNGVRAFHSQLVTRIGWKPDLMIVDYVGEMKDDPRLELHESRYRILRDLRGFGVREKHGTFTCIQPNRTASELDITQYIDESNIGTSFDQYKPLDAFWSINQLPVEKSVELGRVFVIKHRKGISKFPFHVEFDYKGGTLNMTEVAEKIYYSRMNAIAEKKTQNIEKDFEKNDKKKKPLDKLGYNKEEEGNGGQ